MAATPDPTAGETWDNLQFVDGRVFVALNEILRRLQVNLPAAIDYANGQLGYSEGNGIVKPAGYYVAPAASLTDDYINSVLVGGQTETQVQGPGEFKNVTQVTVYSIHDRLEIAEQYEDSLSRAGLIRGVLLRYLTGCIDPQDRPVWRQLEPTGVMPLPTPYAGYIGIALTYTMTQTPDANNWI